MLSRSCRVRIHIPPLPSPLTTPYRSHSHPIFSVIPCQIQLKQWVASNSSVKDVLQPLIHMENDVHTWSRSAAIDVKFKDDIITVTRTSDGCFECLCGWIYNRVSCLRRHAKVCNELMRKGTFPFPDNHVTYCIDVHRISNPSLSSSSSFPSELSTTISNGTSTDSGEIIQYLSEFEVAICTKCGYGPDGYQRSLRFFLRCGSAR